jgi:hypothetical protein
MRSDVFADDLVTGIQAGLPSRSSQAQPASAPLGSGVAALLALRAKAGGARRDRTDDLMLAKHALSQLSYGPVTGRRMPRYARRRPPGLCGVTACRAEARANQSAFARAGFSATAYSRSRERRLVGLGRLELPTSRLSSARSNQLSYKPLTLILNRKDRVLPAQPEKAPDASHKRKPPGSVFVREERETKTAKSRQWSSTILKLLAPDVSKTIR